MKTKGFTLVELLVVIAILAILATVSVVGYTSFINNANNSAAQSELVQIRDYCISYDLTGDKDGKLDKDDVAAAMGTPDMTGKSLTWGTVVDNKGTTDVTTDDVTYNIAVYTKGEGKAYWNIQTGEVTTTAPTGFTAE